MHNYKKLLSVLAITGTMLCAANIGSAEDVTFTQDFDSIPNQHLSGWRYYDLAGTWMYGPDPLPDTDPREYKVNIIDGKLALKANSTIQSYTRIFTSKGVSDPSAYAPSSVVSNGFFEFSTSVASNLKAFNIHFGSNGSKVNADTANFSFSVIPDLGQLRIGKAYDATKSIRVSLDAVRESLSSYTVYGENTYKILFDNTNKTLAVYINGTLIDALSGNNPNDQTWISTGIAFEANSIMLETGTTYNGIQTLYLDNITLANIPEASTSALALGLFVAGLVAVRRYRNKSK